MKFGKWVVKCRIPILILAVALLVPSLIGMIMTRINYDMLTYLPGDIDTVVGQDILMDQYGSDTVIFTDLKLEDARFMREGDHLIIKGYGEDQLTINHFFAHANYQIENFQFGEQKLTLHDFWRDGLPLFVP